MKFLNIFKKNDEAVFYWRLVAALGVAGTGVSAYLLKLEMKVTESSQFACDLSDKFSCTAVALSKYSEFLGQPTAAWGIAAYTLMFIAGLYFANSKKIQKELWYGWLAFLTGSLAFSLYLTYAELFIIKSICIFCVTQQIILLIIVGLNWPIAKKDKRL